MMSFSAKLKHPLFCRYTRSSSETFDRSQVRKPGTVESRDEDEGVDAMASTWQFSWTGRGWGFGSSIWCPKMSLKGCRSGVEDCSLERPSGVEGCPWAAVTCSLGAVAAGLS